MQLSAQHCRAENQCGSYCHKGYHICTGQQQHFVTLSAGDKHREQSVSHCIVVLYTVRPCCASMAGLRTSEKGFCTACIVVLYTVRPCCASMAGLRTSETGFCKASSWRCRTRPGCNLVKYGRSDGCIKLSCAPCLTSRPCRACSVAGRFSASRPTTCICSVWLELDELEKAAVMAVRVCLTTGLSCEYAAQEPQCHV